MVRWILVLCVALGVVLVPRGTNPFSSHEQELQQLVQRMVDRGVPGVSLGLGAGKHTYFVSAGVADVRKQNRMTASHQVRLASVTKAWTALLVWKLIERGELQLSDTVSQYLQPGLLPAEESITIGMLLNHTSGLYDYESSPEFQELFFSHPTRFLHAHTLLEITRKHGLVFIPGTQFAYSNTNYYVLGLILKKVTGKSPNRLFREWIARPSGVHDSSLSRQGAFTSKRFSPGYSYLESPTELVNIHRWNFSFDWTAGSGVSTTKDMIAISNALMKGDILHQRTMKSMLTRQLPSDTYYGFFPYYQSSPVLWIEKSGMNVGTTTLWVMCPEKQLSFFIVLNLSDLEANPHLNTFQMVTDAFREAVHILGWGQARHYGWGQARHSDIWP